MKQDTFALEDVLAVYCFDDNISQIIVERIRVPDMAHNAIFEVGPRSDLSCVPLDSIMTTNVMRNRDRVKGR